MKKVSKETIEELRKGTEAVFRHEVDFFWTQFNDKHCFLPYLIVLPIEKGLKPQDLIQLDNPDLICLDKFPFDDEEAKYKGIFNYGYNYYKSTNRNVMAVMLVSCAWIKQFDITKPLPDIIKPASQYPDKYEGVIFNIVAVENSVSFSTIARMHRNGDEIQLDKPMEMSDENQSALVEEWWKGYVVARLEEGI